MWVPDSDPSNDPADRYLVGGPRRKRSPMNSNDLTARYVEMLRRTGTDVKVDLADEPVTILAHAASGRVFAAAWESDEGLIVRLRLDAMAGDRFPDMEYVDGGTLAYEVIMRTADDVDSLGEMLERAHELAARRSQD